MLKWDFHFRHACSGKAEGLTHGRAQRATTSRRSCTGREGSSGERDGGRGGELTPRRGSREAFQQDCCRQPQVEQTVCPGAHLTMSTDSLCNTARRRKALSQRRGLQDYDTGWPRLTEETSYPEHSDSDGAERIRSPAACK
jgi:hypothetical protein